MILTALRYASPLGLSLSTWALAAALAFAGVQSVRVAMLKADLSQTMADVAEAQLEQMRADAAAAAERNRETQRLNERRASLAQENADATLKTQKRVAAADAAVRRQLDRMRVELDEAWAKVPDPGGAGDAAATDRAAADARPDGRCADLLRRTAEAAARGGGLSNDLAAQLQELQGQVRLRLTPLGK